MSLQGLPDFHQPIEAEGLQIFYPYEGAGNYTLVPDKLEITLRSDGSPDFELEFVRGRNPSQPPKPYGVLEFRVSPHYQMEEALTYVRDRISTASLAPASFSSGFLRFQSLDNLDDLPEELLKPIPLAWNGLGTARFSRQLSVNAATLLKSSFQGKLLALSAAAELEIVGVSPRLPIKVRFNPTELLEVLVSLGNKERQVARKAITDYFRGDLKLLPLEVNGELDSRNINEFAEALTDWVRVRFGTFVPAPTIDARCHIALASPTEIGSGRFEWDLSQPIQAPRPLSLYLNPFEAAYRLVQNQGVEAVVRETIIPPIPTGVQPVSIVTNLPTHWLGILALGVTIRVKPKLPFRPQTQVETVELQASQNIPKINLRFSPTEEPEYTFSTYVVVKDTRGIERLDGEAKPHRGDTLYLSPDDFPVDFVSVEASELLLDIAVVQGICKWLEGSSEISEEFKLKLDQSGVTLALPKGTENATLKIEAHSRDGLGTIKLDPLPAKPLQLNLHSFREYGVQKVEVECVFENDAKPVVFEFLPEGYLETAQEIKLLWFRPSQPKNVLTWIPRSPFQCRYRYRPKLLKYNSNALPEWSDYLSPFESLKIHVLNGVTHTPHFKM